MNTSLLHNYYRNLVFPTAHNNTVQMGKSRTLKTNFYCSGLLFTITAQLGQQQFHVCSVTVPHELRYSLSTVADTAVLYMPCRSIILNTLHAARVLKYSHDEVSSAQRSTHCGEVVAVPVAFMSTSAWT